jgi:ABC-type nitrate/sulfonate/bicarbonate transport system permease component
MSHRKLLQKVLHSNLVVVLGFVLGAARVVVLGVVLAIVLGLLVGWKDFMSEIHFRCVSACDKMKRRMAIAQAFSKASVGQADD